jgi:hypothetical protein
MSTNWANRSKTEINAVELKPVGGGGKGGERMDTFVIYGTPKKPEQTQIKIGDVFQGTFLGTYENEVMVKGAKTKLKTHKIKLDTGKTVGLSGSGLISYQLNLVKPNSTVKITYNGKDEQGRHQFDTLSDSE